MALLFASESSLLLRLYERLYSLHWACLLASLVWHLESGSELDKLLVFPLFMLCEEITEELRVVDFLEHRVLVFFPEHVEEPRFVLLLLLCILHM